MPVTAASPDDVAALEHTIATQQGEIDDLSEVVEDLRARVTALEAGSSTEPPDPGPDPEPPLPGSMQVVLTIGGKQLAFNEAEATGLGDYFDPDHRFVMSCSRATHPELPGFRVDFRSTDAWKCVVFEYSDPLRGDCANLAYSVTITDGDIYTDAIDIPDHYANASWRWQSCPWPHPLTPLETLHQRKLLPRHDAALACGKASNLTNVHDAPPMSLCGFTPDMGMTGGRADIGFVTGWQGEWLCMQSEEMQRTVIVQGEAAFNWRLRDPETGAIFDTLGQYPNASFHWGNGPSGSPQLYHGAGWHPTLDIAHAPHCYLIPFLLTGDPYYLEYLQGEACYAPCETPRNTTEMPAGPQVRGYAWMMRTLFGAAMATPEEVPPWLLPKSVFTTELERIRVLLENMQHDGWVYREFSHIIDGIYRWQHAFWQHDYATAVVAWVSMQFPAWEQQREYMIKCIADRNDPASGWCSGYPTNYWTDTNTHHEYQPETSFRTWAECWDWNSQHVYTDTPPDETGNRCRTLEEHLQINTTYDYFSSMMVALRMGAQAGSELARTVLSKIEPAWEQGLRTVGYTEWKYCASS